MSGAGEVTVRQVTALREAMAPDRFAEADAEFNRRDLRASRGFSPGFVTPCAYLWNRKQCKQCEEGLEDRCWRRRSSGFQRQRDARDHDDPDRTLPALTRRGDMVHWRVAARSPGTGKFMSMPWPAASATTSASPAGTELDRVLADPVREFGTRKYHGRV